MNWYKIIASDGKMILTRMIPTVYINPRTIIAIMQFKGDPREKSDR